MKKGILLPFLLLSCMVYGQIAPHVYWVQFIDKNLNTYSLSKPLEFLSQRALDRRARQGIVLAENDLPVTKAYLDSVRKIGGQILFTSRWQNAAAVYSPDSNFLFKVGQISIVKNTTLVYKTGVHALKQDLMTAAADTYTPGNYGDSYNQVHMLNGDQLHNSGYTGKGMVIAQLDAGFIYVDSLTAFKPLRDRGGILGTHNFLTGTDSVFTQDLHGMEVLSVMSGQLPGQLMGTAIDADYYLFHTENSASETESEEGTWAAGMERADSAGADVINSSLGYTQFDNPAMNHTYADLDGHTTIISREASLVASKGMILVNSAGNEGNNSWHYISAPADAENILAAGANDALGKYIYFSSVGPTPDGRIKPDVSAQGYHTIAASSVDGQTAQVSGTSLSAPILTGLVTCLWQEFRNKTSYQIMDAVRKSASIYAHPNDSIGYGLPDFAIARQLLQLGDSSHNFMGTIYPNPFASSFSLNFYTSQAQQADVIMFNMIGQELYHTTVQSQNQDFTRVTVNTPYKFPSGVYFVCVKTGADTFVSQVVKY